MISKPPSLAHLQTIHSGRTVAVQPLDLHSLEVFLFQVRQKHDTRPRLPTTSVDTECLHRQQQIGRHTRIALGERFSHSVS